MSDTSSDATERLEQQLAFLLEIDKLKRVERQTLTTDGARRENTAEHSWHLAMYALVLSEWSNNPIDAGRALLMCLVHDIVEIDAGDTFAYDTAGYETKTERERAAAERLFGMLPSDQGAMLRALWDEFEAGETAEAKFANAVDRLQPVMLNHATAADSPWKRHGVKFDQVVARNSPIADGAKALWDAAQRRLDEVVDAGHLER